jgi:hypothetical protein
MSRRKPACRVSKRARQQRTRQQNKTDLRELLGWFLQPEELFSKSDFHGNTKWDGGQLVTQALLWSWQETRQVTDAFDHAEEVCVELGLERVARSYTSMMNALARYHELFRVRLRARFQAAAEEVAGADWECAGWVPIAFDGSRTTAPRTLSNERAFCAPHHGQGKRAKYGKKKSQGLRRQRNKQTPPAPQAWITMLWHMGLRLPWTWRLGPSNASEREHVKEILGAEKFPKNTLFCGDAGFVGYPLWSLIRERKQHFLVRVGGNVTLLSQQADVQKLGGGIVLCWPKGQQNSGEPPLRLRLVQVQVNKTKMWLLTSVLDPKQLSKRQLVKLYKMRWGIEIEFRGLKQTLDKHALRCRSADRLLVELDWSLRGMAIAELLALRAQKAAAQHRGKSTGDPPQRSLANTMRALRKCMRGLHKTVAEEQTIHQQLARAIVQRYHNQTDKRARYRPQNPDKKPLGVPTVRKLNAAQIKRLTRDHPQLAA